MHGARENSSAPEVSAPGRRDAAFSGGLRRISTEERRSAERSRVGLCTQKNFGRSDA